MNIQCPNCGEDLETPCEIEEGQHILCPFCSVKFEYRAKPTFCPNCSQELVLPHGVEEGQHLKCPYCGEKFAYHEKHSTSQYAPIAVCCPYCKTEIEIVLGASDENLFTCPNCCKDFIYSCGETAPRRKSSDRGITSGALEDAPLLSLASFPRGRERSIFMWRRWWARIIDILPLMYITWGLVFGGMLMGLHPLSAIILSIVLLIVFAVCLETLSFHMFKNTFGNWVMGLAVRHSNGECPTTKEYFRREMAVVVFGCGCYFPIICLILWFYNYQKNSIGKLAFYDRKMDTAVFALRRNGNFTRYAGWMISVLYFILIISPQAWIYSECSNAKKAVADAKKAVAAEMATYVSSEKIKVDFDKLPDRIGAFGFKWGEKSRDLKHKYSCSIVYSVPYNGMYTMMELAYNSKGELFGITFKGPAQQQYTELNFDTNYAREAAMKSIIIDGFLPLFNILKTHAEQVLDQHIQWTFDSDSRQFLGMTNLQNGCGYAGIVRLEVKSSGGVQLLSIFKN